MKARLNGLAAKIPDKSIALNYQEYFKQRLWQDFRSFTGKTVETRSAGVASVVGISPEKQRLTRYECGIIGTVIAHPLLLKDTVIEEDFASFEFSHLEIDKMRQDILSNTAQYLEETEPNNLLGALIAANINEKLAIYLKTGVDYAKKSATPNQAWESVSAQYHFELAESDMVGEEDFEKLQEKFKSLLEVRQKINASFGD